jgi:ribosomal protein S18 acetylase RimI-like enzyme
MSDVKIERLSPEHAAQVAQLHVSGIGTGFISSLGVDFVMSLYEAIAKSPSSFGFVAQQDGKVLGFVAFTTNLNALYKSVVLKSGWRLALKLFGKMFSLKRIKKVFETLAYPGRVKKMKLPSAELLSIVVAEEGQGKGLGTQLLQESIKECANKGIQAVKVLVGAGVEPANMWYANRGFKLEGQMDSHGNLSNIYTLRIK